MTVNYYISKRGEVLELSYMIFLISIKKHITIQIIIMYFGTIYLLISKDKGGVGSGFWN